MCSTALHRPPTSSPILPAASDLALMSMIPESYVLNSAHLTQPVIDDSIYKAVLDHGYPTNNHVYWCNGKQDDTFQVNCEDTENLYKENGKVQDPATIEYTVSAFSTLTYALDESLAYTGQSIIQPRQLHIDTYPSPPYSTPGALTDQTDWSQPSPNTPDDFPSPIASHIELRRSRSLSITGSIQNIEFSNGLSRSSQRSLDAPAHLLIEATGRPVTTSYNGGQTDSGSMASPSKHIKGKSRSKNSHASRSDPLFSRVTKGHRAEKNIKCQRNRDKLKEGYAKLQQALPEELQKGKTAVIVNRAAEHLTSLEERIIQLCELIEAQNALQMQLRTSIGNCYGGAR